MPRQDKTKTEYWRGLCKNFADRLVESSDYYVKNRDADKDKAKKDIALGKIAEFIAAEFIPSIDPSLPTNVVPDITVYSSSKKSWAPDLEFPSLSVDVKSYIVSRFPPSVTFQWANQSGANGGRDHFFDEARVSARNEIVCLVSMNPSDLRESRVHSIVSRDSALPMFKDPVSERLIGFKKCLYFKDLELSCL